MKQLTSELIKTCSKRDISDTVLPMLTMHMCNSKQGRNAMAKYIASNNKVVLPHGGTSKGAKSKARKSADKIVNGVVTMLVKTPEQASFRQILEKAQRTSSNNGNEPLMEPRNPTLSHYSEAVLPQVGLQIANDETTCGPDDVDTASNGAPMLQDSAESTATDNETFPAPTAPEEEQDSDKYDSEDYEATEGSRPEVAEKVDLS
jgi:hypothetical protein